MSGPPAPHGQRGRLVRICIEIACADIGLALYRRSDPDINVDAVVLGDPITLRRARQGAGTRYADALYRTD